MLINVFFSNWFHSLAIVRGTKLPEEWSIFDVLGFESSHLKIPVLHFFFLFVDSFRWRQLAEQHFEYKTTGVVLFERREDKGTDHEESLVQPTDISKPRKQVVGLPIDDNHLLK